MDTRNVDAFNLYAFQIFDRLYDNFPKSSDIVLPQMVQDPHDADQREIFIGTMRFLKLENFLTYEEITADEDRFTEAVLTAKGLAVLGAVPESSHGSTPFILRIRASLQAGTAESAKAVMQSLISYAVTSMVR